MKLALYRYKWGSLHFDSRYFAEGVDPRISPTFELLNVFAKRHPFREEIDQGLGIQDRCQELLYRNVPLDLCFEGGWVPIFIWGLQIEAPNELQTV